MKKATLAIIATILLLSAIISTCLTSYTQSINVVHEPSEASDVNQQAMNVESTENGEKSQDVGETSTSCNRYCNLNDTSQDGNACRKVCPPNGRIYRTPESPYAYIPTYMPQKPSLPFMPPELEN